MAIPRTIGLTDSNVPVNPQSTRWVAGASAPTNRNDFVDGGLDQFLGQILWA